MSPSPCVKDFWSEGPKPSSIKATGKPPTELSISERVLNPRSDLIYTSVREIAINIVFSSNPLMGLRRKG